MEQHTSDTLNRYYQKKKKRKQKRKYAFYTLLTVFFVILITVLSLTVFFNINDIAVTGNAHYSTSQIVAASGLTKGQNLFRMNKFKIIDTLYQKLPYLSEVSIDRHLPVGIEIIVTEAKPYLLVKDGDSFLVLDENLKVLEKTTEQPADLPVVEDIAILSSNVGAVLTADGGADTRLLALTKSLKENLGDNCVTAINIQTSYEVTFEYMDRITVNVGTVENIDNKLKLVKYVIDENRSQEDAEIDVTSGTRAYYRSVDKLADKDLPVDDENTEQTDQKENE